MARYTHCEWVYTHRMVVQKRRNVGADVIRVLAMLMVSVLHVNFLSGCTSCFPNYLYETVCIQAVNLFAMLTGYLCIEAGWKIRRYINMWFQVAFYSMEGRCWPTG